MTSTTNDGFGIPQETDALELQDILQMMDLECLEHQSKANLHLEEEEDRKFK